MTSRPTALDEHAILSGGPRVVAAVAAAGADPQDLRYLGHACARRAREAANYSDALAWSEAAVSCYREVVRSLEAGYVRHGAEMTLHGVMLAMIRRYGSESPELQSYLNAVVAWCDALRRGFADEQEFAAARAQLQEPAMLLQEALDGLQAIWRMGLLAPDHEPWFAAAGLVREPRTSPRSEPHAPPLHSVHRLSLRPHLPPGASPLAAVTVGEVTLAAIASNWGDWAGLAAEAPAVKAAMAVLEAAARTNHPDWPATLRRAFAAVPQALAPYVQPDPHFHGFYDPITSLTCMVTTSDEAFVARVGSTVACLLTRGRLERTTAPLTNYERYRCAGLAQEQLDRIPEHLRDNVADRLGPTTRENPTPEVIVWPRLRPDQSVLLTSSGVLRLLKPRLPLHPEATGDSWLRAALSIEIDDLDDRGFPAFADRIGVLVVPA